MNRDPIGYEGKTYNLYEYVQSRALIAVDPQGMMGDFPGSDVFPGIAGDYDYVEDDWPRYYPFWNDIGLPPDFFDDDGNVRCDLPCRKKADLANENWHAWWDQHLEEDSECEWLYERIKEEALDTWTSGPFGLGNVDNYLDMAEEAMSEAASSWALYKCNGRPPTYGNSGAPPSHNDSPGDTWYGNPHADIPMSKELFDLLDHAMKNGCKRNGRW